jgi:hypothetical protein
MEGIEGPGEDVAGHAVAVVMHEKFNPLFSGTVAPAGRDDDLLRVVHRVVKRIHRIDQQVHDHLRRQGAQGTEILYRCGMMQGYLFSKPVTGEAVTELLKADKRLGLPADAEYPVI